MGFISGSILVIFIVSSLFLALFVLIQDDQGDVLGGLSGNSSSNPFGGSAGNVLTRITSILGILFLVTSFTFAAITKSRYDDDVIGESRRLQAGEDGIIEWWKEDAKSEDDDIEAMLRSMDDESEDSSDSEAETGLSQSEPEPNLSQSEGESEPEAETP